MTRSASNGLRRNAGFTFTEVIVTLSVASILAAAAVPATGTLLNQYRLSHAAKQIAMEVARARMQAIGQNRWVRLRKTSVGIVREVSTNGTSFAVDGEAVPLPDGVLMIFGGSNGPTFNRQGIASSQSYALVTNSQGLKAFYINVLGRVEQL
jgi:prepilin-type N-terminal cleavage/methylation domain-containing protein